MKILPASNPNLPYHGNTLDHEIIAANTHFPEEDINAEHLSTANITFHVDAIILSPSNDKDDIQACYEISHHQEEEASSDITLDDDFMTWEDSF